MCEILSSQLLRVAFLDDHDVVRCGLAVKLAEESDMVVVGNYDNSKKMMAGLRQNPADVLLIDYSLGPTEVDGVTLIRVLRAKFPASRILVVSALGDPETIALALRAGFYQEKSTIAGGCAGSTYGRLRPALPSQYNIEFKNRMGTCD